MRLAGSGNGGYLMCSGRDRGLCNNAVAYTQSQLVEATSDGAALQQGTDLAEVDHAVRGDGHLAGGGDSREFLLAGVALDLPLVLGDWLADDAGVPLRLVLGHCPVELCHIALLEHGRGNTRPATFREFFSL